jgi:anti-anti-sigma factor
MLPSIQRDVNRETARVVEQMMYTRIVVHDQNSFEIAYSGSTIPDRASLSKPMLIEVRQKDDICLVRCEGHLITANQEYLCAKKDEIKRATSNKVLVDFSDASDIGSAGIGFIVGVYTSTRNSGGRFVLVGIRPRVREVLDITRVSTAIPLAADIASGLVTLRDEGLAVGAQTNC